MSKALLLSHQSERYGEIFARIVGVVFIGTPHHGADFFRIMDMLLRICFSANELVKDAKVDSNLIKEINEAFPRIARKFQLASFYETVETPLGVRLRCFLSATN